MAGHFAGTRLRRSFDTIHRRAQDAARGKLHDAAASGHLRASSMPISACRTSVCPYLSPTSFPSPEIQKYPTDFKGMADTDMQLITTRGEQLTRMLIGHYCPKLM